MENTDAKAALLCAVALAVPSLSRAQDNPADNPKPADASPDDKPPDKSDPNDIRNSIGNLDLVRGFPAPGYTHPPGHMVHADRPALFSAGGEG